EIADAAAKRTSMRESAAPGRAFEETPAVKVVRQYSFATFATTSAARLVPVTTSGARTVFDAPQATREKVPDPNERVRHSVRRGAASRTPATQGRGSDPLLRV